ncbi:hypothetical protein H0H81_000406 [Sphagnurus paluster]|uniref:Transmembrane protein n=1 Tax=Sphagnurus paluster TaxID=117069 RepID=A0A9P7K380_9AGAR|nr:hypothetical protein H0H81_000406 [Sphagnurus paluster]
MAVNLNAISEIPCQEVTWISKGTHALPNRQFALCLWDCVVADAVGTCCSSLILILRTRAVWHRDLKVTLLLGILFLGQIALWIQTMAFDLIILLLCAYRLGTSRRSSTLAHVLWRDGIGYFCAAFGANLVQTVMASLGLNPVMNIMALPFALVVSVIAATTVFRNVFTAYDAFSSDTSGQGGLSSSGAHTGPLYNINRPTTGSQRVTTTSTRNMTNEIPLNHYKSTHDVGQISIHRVVELDVENNIQTKSQGLDSEHRLSNEKARGL